MRRNRTRYAVLAIAIGLLLGTTTALATEGEEEKQERLRHEKVRAKNAASFVKIQYYFKKSDRPQHPFEHEEMLDTILTKTSQDTVGVIISPDGLVFVAEGHLPPDMIDKIVVTGPDDQTLEARPERILSKSPGEILRITEPLPASWKALSFSPPPEVLDIKTKLYAITMNLGAGTHGFSQDADARSYFSVSRTHPVRKRGNSTEIPDFYRIGGRGAMVICDADGQALGLTTHHRIELGDDALPWLGPDILADPGIDRVAGEQKAKELFGKYIYQVKITFRSPPKEDDDYDMGMFGAHWGGRQGRGDSHKEMIVYGLAVAADKLLVPQAMKRMMVVGIDAISVEIGDESVPASFGGVLKQFSGTVFVLGEPKLPDVVTIDPQVMLPRCVPMWTVHARELAGKDLVINYNRWLRKQRGHANKLYRALARASAGGVWLLDEQGRLAGIYSSARRNYQRLMPYLKGEDHTFYDEDMMPFMMGQRFSRRWRGPSGIMDMQIFDTAALTEILKDIPANYDEHIKHLTKEQQKERVWLGVEFTAITKEMAKQMDLRKQTQDGRIGLMINRVYANSPADKMGLAEGDVLLKLSVPDAPWPIELKFRRSRDYEGPDWEDMDIPSEIEAMGYRMPRKRPWPSRGNFFTRMLQVIGKGTPSTVTFVHEGQQVEKQFVIEQSLPDSLSAAKYKDEKLGITVKDLTYEIAAALRLGQDEKAIVVSKVEPGTPTALARIKAFELIRAVNGQQIGSAEDFESAIAKAKEEGKKSVRITVEWMGKTRLADLKFEAKQKGLRDVMRFLPGLGGGPQ